MPSTGDDPTPPRVFRAADDESSPATASQDIDLQALAEEVYALLERELWLERERQGGHPIW